MLNFLKVRHVFFKDPYIPDKEVKTVLIDGRERLIGHVLNKFGIQTIKQFLSSPANQKCFISYILSLVSTVKLFLPLYLLIYINLSALFKALSTESSSLKKTAPTDP